MSQESPWCTDVRIARLAGNRASPQRDPLNSWRNRFGPPVELAIAMADSIICDRSFEFAVRILTLCNRLADRSLSARHLATQLVRCGTSIGSNAEEAQKGQTKPDYLAKMGVSRKEARETCWWLRVAVRSEIVTAEEVSWEQSESLQLLKMIRAAILKAKSSPDRGGGI
jgi:four helix bundle protein